jgi:hypothetical protein
MSRRKIVITLLAICVMFFGTGVNSAYAVPTIFSATDSIEESSPGSVDYNVTAISASGVSDNMTAEIVIQKNDSTTWVDTATVAKTEENVSRFDATGTIDLGNYGSGDYRMKVVMSDVVDGITTTYEPIYSNTVSVTSDVKEGYNKQTGSIQNVGKQNTNKQIIVTPLTVSPLSLDPPSFGGTYTINMSGVSSLNVTSNVTWARAIKIKGGDGSYTVTVDANASIFMRNGTITISQNGAADKIISIKQASALSNRLTHLLRALPSNNTSFVTEINKPLNKGNLLF